MKKNAWVHFPPTLSAESVSRLHAIDYDIAANERSLTRLHALANGALDLRQTGCTPAIRRYRPTPEDKQRVRHFPYATQIPGGYGKAVGGGKVVGEVKGVKLNSDLKKIRKKSTEGVQIVITV